MTEQTPPPAPPAEPAQGGAAEPTPASTGWAASGADTPVPGTAGFVYADVPNRTFAYIIDAILLFIVTFIISLLVYGIVGQPTTATINADATDLGNLATVQVNWLATLVGALVSTAISAVYFIYTWTKMRGTPGMKVLGMQVGNQGDGATLTTEQAIRRWIFLGAPLGLISALAGISSIGLIISLLGLLYLIFLLVTTAQSPTKQGFHDKQAGSMVVKAARSVA
jgi:uncharacterized RDD family membrane protein YckC